MQLVLQTLACHLVFFSQAHCHHHDSRGGQQVREQMLTQKFLLWEETKIPEREEFYSHTKEILSSSPGNEGWFRTSLQPDR